MTFTKPYLVPLRKIKLAKGNVFHALKSNENSFKGFGELYFSRIEFGKIKGWRRHNKYTLNLIVIEGLVKFIVASNDTFETDNPEYLEEFVIGPSENYKRLVVPPGHWMALRVSGDVRILLQMLLMVHMTQRKPTLRIFLFLNMLLIRSKQKHEKTNVIL